MNTSGPQQWRSNSGFILASVGAAVGLGNIWRYSYVVGENGGAAFILAYLVAVSCLGLPLLIAELAIGRHTKGDAVATFALISDRPPWRWTGWLGVVACVAILSYYPVIAGWVSHYLLVYASGAQLQGGFEAQFQSLIVDPVRALFWFGVILAVSGGVVAAGVVRGIERISRLLMPVFAVLIVVLALYGLTLPGAPVAIEFLFSPDWSRLLSPQTWLAAVGQAFFSIGLAVGVLVTYGSYIPAGTHIPRAAVWIVAADTLIALVMGTVIFSIVFSVGLDPAQGPTLAFVTLPEVFVTMPAGRWVAVAFFLLLLVAALTSVIALIEVPVAVVMAHFGMRRNSAVVLVCTAAAALGVPSALGYGVLKDAFGGMVPLLDRIDHLASNILLPVSGIAVSLFAGWIWPSDAAGRASQLPDGWTRRIWIWSLRVLIPGAVALVMVSGLGLI